MYSKGEETATRAAAQRQDPRDVRLPGDGTTEPGEVLMGRRSEGEGFGALEPVHWPCDDLQCARSRATERLGAILEAGLSI